MQVVSIEKLVSSSEHYPASSAQIYDSNYYMNLKILWFCESLCNFKLLMSVPSPYTNSPYNSSKAWI